MSPTVAEHSQKGGKFFFPGKDPAGTAHPARRTWLLFCAFYHQHGDASDTPFFPPMQTLRFGSNHRNDPFLWLKRTFFPPDFLGCFWGIPAWDLYLILTASPFVQSHVPSCCSSVTPSQYVLLLLMLFFRKAWDEEIH